MIFFIRNNEKNKYINDLNLKTDNQCISLNGTLNTSFISILKDLYTNKKTSIVGGDTKKIHNFEDWKSSITFENCEIIGYGLTIPIIDVLDHYLRKNLEKSLGKIQKKYNNRKLYLQTIEALKLKIKQNKNKWKEKRKGNDSDGIIKENDIIYSKYFKIEKEWKTFYVNRDFNEPTKDIIVGWKKNSNKDNNGEWFLKENPLLKERMDAHFSSQFLRGINYGITIYFMDYPE